MGDTDTGRVTSSLRVEISLGHVSLDWVRWWILIDAVNVDDDLPSAGDWLLHLTFIYTLTHERRDRTRRGKGFKLVKYIFNEGFSCWSCFMSMYLCLFCPVNVLCPIYY